MTILLSGKTDSYAQFITVLLIFVAVLAVTAYVTKWMATYQKQQGMNCNMEIVDTMRISNNKYVQIIRVGDTYKVIAVCKDTVTFLGDLPKEQLLENTATNVMPSFKELLGRAMKKDSSNDES